MKKIDYSFTGGMPLAQDILAWQQTGSMDALAAIAKAFVKPGNTNPIVMSGCVDDGTNYSEGWLYHNGELVFFPGGAHSGSHLITISDAYTTLVYEDANVRNTYINRTASYNGAGAYNLSTLARNPVMDALTGWTDAGTTIVLVASGGGSVTVASGDVLYNKYKLIGTMLHWQLRIRDATIAGTVTTIGVQIPTALADVGFNFGNAATSGGFKTTGIYNGTPTLIQTLGGNAYGAANLRVVELTVSGGGNFTTGTDDQDFDINIVGELTI